MFRHGRRSVPCSGALSRVRLVFGGGRACHRAGQAAAGAWSCRSGPRASAWSSLSAASERAWLPFALHADTLPWLPGFPGSQGRHRRSARSGKTNRGRSGAGSGAGSQRSDHHGLSGAARSDGRLREIGHGFVLKSAVKRPDAGSDPRRHSAASRSAMVPVDRNKCKDRGDGSVACPHAMALDRVQPPPRKILGNRK